jgi:predicted phosphodiesterase
MAQRLFRIQYVSDIHLEFYKKCPFPLLLKPNARYLALAGDIGQPNTQIWNSFFNYVNNHWDRVFYVTGNHEYYSKRTPMNEIHNTIKESLKPFTRVTMLDSSQPDNFIAKENVAVVGNTLWTEVPDSLVRTVEESMNDYKKIFEEEGKSVSVETLNNLHYIQKAQLLEKIHYYKYQKIPTVVITHHIPSFKLISPRFAGSPVNAAFASNCENLMLPNVKCWIYGHTHNCANSLIGKTMCLVNARGYPNESCPGFLRDAFYEFPIVYEDSEVNEEVVQSAVKPIEEEVLFI